jgi:3',5'-cyclic AMP phosphodiesterase CpdA
MISTRFAQISDLHLGADDTFPSFDWDQHNQASDLTQSAIDAINASEPEFVVVTGDLTHRGTSEGFSFARRMLDQLRMPYYVLPGNRDIRLEGERELFCSIFAGHGPTDHTYAAWESGGTRCLTLDACWRTRDGIIQEAKPKKKKRGGVEVPPEQVRWLERELLSHPHAPTFIFLHYPLVPPAERFLAHDPNIASELHNREEILELLTRHPQVRAVFCGHQHYNEIVQVPAAGGELLHCMLGATAEYPMMWREVSVDDAWITVATHFTSVGEQHEQSPATASWTIGTDADRSASISTLPVRPILLPAPPASAESQHQERDRQH